MLADNCSMQNEWIVYILKCSDDTLYTGVSVDVDRRIAMHNAGKGAKYTRGRGPVSICYREICQSKADALRREHEIKSLSRKKKLALIDKCYLE